MTVPAETKKAVETVQLHLSGEFELDFKIPFILMGERAVAVEPQTLGGKRVMWVSNDKLAFKVSAEFGANLIRLVDAQGRAFLADDFPKIGPKFFFEHYVGGIQPAIFTIGTENPFTEPERITTSLAEDGPWRGMKTSWTITKAEKLRGQQYTLTYLTLPESEIIRIRLEHRNPTLRRIKWATLSLVHLALQGDMDDTIIKVPGGIHPWIRPHAQKFFVSPPNLNEPWSRVTRGDQSLTMLCPAGFHGTTMAFDFGEMIAGGLLAALETDPEGETVLEFALALNQPEEIIDMLRDALAKRRGQTTAGG